jgi:predicted acyltransferase
MIVVNNPGGNQYYSILLHNYESYNIHLVYSGLSFADIIFPLFIFVMGATIPYSFTNRLSREGKGKVLIHILSRTLILFGLGLLVNGFPYYDLSTLRIMGVLQLLSLCYLFGSLVFLFLKTKWRMILAVVIPIIYCLILIQAPLTLAGSIPSQVDRFVLGSHIYMRGVFDPEGLLSTISALGTISIGILVGE